jgi:hypothetical protein
MVCAKLVTNLFPESVAIHLLVVITEWSICKGTALQIHVIQLSHVCSHNLISIDKNNLFESIRETTSLEDNETRIASTIEDHEAGLQVDHNIEKNYLPQRKWKYDIQKQNLIRPYNPLLLFLFVQPRWPFVRDKLILESIFLSHVGYDVLAGLLVRQQQRHLRSSH